MNMQTASKNTASPTSALLIIGSPIFTFLSYRGWDLIIIQVKNPPSTEPNNWTSMKPNALIGVNDSVTIKERVRIGLRRAPE